ncbi:Zinc finger BED domain-containing protein 1 [Merluccius polli]|uniref:Zinc finger BED domain-containing protein 1 n=1 Tax=Merluccius polli TaxID=89951 RepID=A0AA47MJ48_MERPO|nr:Zinc finger BED domain-containing protein 1 [Merluccius polli]
MWQPAVTAALLSPDVRKREKEISTFIESDISNLEFIEALKPVKVATCVMSDENNPTISVIAPLHAQLLQATQKETLRDLPFVRDLKEAVHQELSKRYTSEVEKTTGVQEEEHCQEVVRQDQEELGDCAATAEVCQTKRGDRDSQGLLSAKRRVTCALDELLGEYFWGNQQAGTSTTREWGEVNEYNRAAPLPLSENPLEWWKEHHHEYPFLAKLAKQYLCVAGTSVSAERVFSTAGDIVTAQRSSLTTEHVDQLLFLHKNLEIPKH